MTQNVTTFDNGVRLVTEKIPGCLSASIGIWSGRGARHEKPSQNGIAHFLEHMAFKGTKTRTALDIAQEIENVGGYLNAYTSKESTAYYARVLGADVPKALDVLSDIILNPSFDDGEIETERGVILQEIGQTLDTPDDIIFDWLSEETFPDQALGRPILGTPDHVRHFQADDFRKFLHENYGGDQLVISAAGDVDHDMLSARIGDVFSKLTYQSQPFEESVVFRAGQKRVVKDLEQAHIALAFQAPSYRDEDQHATQLLSAILGGGMSSRLFQSIREKSGLCYSIFSSFQPLADTGQLYIYSGTSAEGIAPLMTQLATEVKRFAASLEVQELERAKAQMRSGSVMALEAVSTRTERNARQMQIYDRLIPIKESLEKISAITLSQVAELADRLFRTDPQMVLYGPIETAVEFDQFVKDLRE